MKVFLVSKGSTGFDGLKRTERDKPSAGPGQVLVRMRAASLNFRDLAIVAGKYFRGPVERDTIPLSDGASVTSTVAYGTPGSSALSLAPLASAADTYIGATSPNGTATSFALRSVATNWRHFVISRWRLKLPAK